MTAVTSTGTAVSPADESSQGCSSGPPVYPQIYIPHQQPYTQQAYTTQSLALAQVLYHPPGVAHINFFAGIFNITRSQYNKLKGRKTLSKVMLSKLCN
jgi:hypothetical protein